MCIRDTYDGVAHPATGTVTGAGGASLGPLTFTYSGSSQPPVNAGTYDVVASFAGDANYAAASASTTISVTRAPLTVRALDAVKRFGAPLPMLTATMTGFVNGDSAASLGGALALTTTATQQSAVGAYPIVPSGVTSENYTIAFITSTLTVTRGAVDVTLVTSPEPSGLDAPMRFTASVSACLLYTSR